MLVYLGLGSNLGEREANLKRALELLNTDLISVTRQSSIYETAPMDVTDQPAFLNMVVECRAGHLPIQLMKKLLKLEKQMGRDRSSKAVKRGPRLIDIDLLLYGNSVINTPGLTVPHPGMLARRFVLEPLLELAPRIRDPRTNRLMADALLGVEDQQVRRI
jgi:2-amino-4-hydroxy-6-hydroxymethyldihydropteridine diphosphokinase